MFVSAASPMIPEPRSATANNRVPSAALHRPGGLPPASGRSQPKNSSMSGSSNNIRAAPDTAAPAISIGMS